MSTKRILLIAFLTALLSALPVIAFSAETATEQEMALIYTGFVRTAEFQNYTKVQKVTFFWD